jgi:hypothetical protein
VKYLNRAGGSFSKTSRCCDHLVQSQLASGWNLCILPHGSGNGNRRSAVALQYEHTDEWFFNVPVVSGREIAFKLPFSATLRFDSTDQRKSDVPIAADLNSPGRVVNGIDCDFDQIAWAKEIWFRVLSLNAGWLWFSSCWLLRQSASKHAAYYYDR